MTEHVKPTTELLRLLLEKRQAGPFKTLDDGEQATREMIERKRAGQS